MLSGLFAITQSKKRENRAGLLRAQIERRAHSLTGLFAFTRLGWSFSEQHFLTNLRSTRLGVVSNLTWRLES
ncbi:hypothetical protein D0851_00510 [Marinobacter sp. Arc7-DN-1]|nr:hypothetical protein D0851_00510 [Marinobacter sp. Arc7-DN-1]